MTTTLEPLTPYQTASFEYSRHLNTAAQRGDWECARGDLCRRGQQLLHDADDADKKSYARA